MLKAYKYRLYPNQEQQELFMKHIGACRFTYNWALENKIRAYEMEKKASIQVQFARNVSSWLESDQRMVQRMKQEAPGVSVE